MPKPHGPTPRTPTPSPFIPPYAPSWVDRFTALVDRLPGPAWAYFLTWGVATYFLISAVQWLAGTYPPGAFSRVHAFGAFLTPYAIALIHYLDRSAAAAMKRFRPALRGDDSLAARLTYLLTTLPAQLALAVSLIVMVGGTAIAGGASYLLRPAGASATSVGDALGQGFVALFQIGPTPVSYAVTFAVLVLNWWVGGTLALHTVRRLALVARIYKRHTTVDVLKQGPLYALSRLTSQTTIGAVLLVYGLASIPVYVSQPLGALTVAAIILLAVASFALPLVGVHNVLAGEKERLLEGIADRLHTAGDELHRRIDAGKYQGMDELNKALAGLEIERNMIAAMPTWPWQPETLRTLLIALLLPLAVWLTQYILQKVLG